jgi:hypothetical protein
MVTPEIKEEYAKIVGKSLDQVEKELKDSTISKDTIKETVATNRVAKLLETEMVDTL